MYTLNAESFFQNTEQTVALEPRVPQEKFPEHAHEFSEIVIVHYGCGAHLLNDCLKPVGAGSVFFLNGEDRHAFTDVAELQLSNILYRLPHVETRLAHIHAQKGAKKEWQIGRLTQQKVNALLTQMEQNSADSAVNTFWREGLLLQVLAILLEEKYRHEPHSSIDNRAWQLVNDLRANFQEAIDWEELADRYFLPSRTLRRKINEYTGMSAQRYLTWLRLIYACNSLQNSAQGITQIASDSGFEDSNHFATLFRQHFDCSPSEFRRLKTHGK